MEEQNFAQILSAQQSVGDCLLATVLEGPDQGRQLLLGGRQLLWPSAPSALLVRGMDVLGSMQSPDICILEGVRVFVQPLTAPVRLVVCGGGHVAQAVVRLAQVLGLPVCALEDRPEFAAALEQAGAAQVLLGSYAENLSRLPGSKGDCYVVLTRGHRYDLDCLTQILQKPLSYVGVMASRRRAELLRSQLRESGAAPEQMAALHSPVGLAIGAETAQEIALSILAQIVQCKNSTPNREGFTPSMLKIMTDKTDWVLATVVARQGSAPRSPGAKMLVGRDGLLAGSVGGGILEHEAQQLAQKMLAEGQNCCLVEFSSQGTGTGAMAACGGTVTLFLQRGEAMQ